MKHLNEEQLVLYYYGEAGDRRAIEEHLAGCDSCRAGYQDLQRLLAAVAAAPAPERAGAYGSEVWQRLRPRLAERAGFRWTAWLGPRRWALVGAMAALVLVAFLAGRFWPRPEPETRVAQPISNQVRERILLVAVGEHLERSQIVLVELVNAQAEGTVDISAEQESARDLVSANRLYRQTAARAGHPGIASVLDELERVLLEIAHSPTVLSSAEMDAIRKRIEGQGVLFKVRVVGSRVRQQANAPPQKQAGERL